VILSDEVSEVDRSDVERAVATCPTEALRIE